MLRYCQWSTIGTRRLRRPFVWLLIAQQLLAGARDFAAVSCRSRRLGGTFPLRALRMRLPVGRGVLGSLLLFHESGEGRVGTAARRCRAGVRRGRCQAGSGRSTKTNVPSRSLPSPMRPASRAPSHDVGTENDDKQGRDENRSSGGVSLLSALHCHGLTQQWQAVRVSWPGDRHVGILPVFLPARPRRVAAVSQTRLLSFAASHAPAE